jgi:lipoprotein-releasing system permease protein
MERAAMYKYLLCWRYLRTRYIALASIISVMLGVATMIVVNAVMAGFSEKMRDRLHGVLADVVVESYNFDGFHDPDSVMALIRQIAGDDVVAMAPTIETYGIMTINLGGNTVTRQVQIIGVRPEQRAQTGDFAEYLKDEQGNRIAPSFEVPERLRRNTPAGALLEEPSDPDFAQALKEHAVQQVPEQGTILGYALATIHRSGTNSDEFIAPQGAKVILTFATGGRKPEPAHDDFAVVGFFKSGMSEYDSSHVYVPLERLQYLRRLGDGEGRGAVNQIQIRARPGANLDQLATKIQRSLDRMRPLAFHVVTWEQKQGPLLAAVAVEQNILNMLLFFIIAVAGFGILAIFSMIVVEKTRDIGVLKALGASTAGVRGIFLGYGLSLGLVGSGVGMIGGLLFVYYINKIEEWLSKVTGRKVFDDTIYYFNEIPTLVNPWTVAWIVSGALLIAVAASVWPAQRASKLHPVQALRFE